MITIFKRWIIVKAAVTSLFLLIVFYRLLTTTPVDEANELLLIELCIYTITSFLLLYCFLHMYHIMKYVILFDIIFLIFIAYQFHINYVVLLLDMVTIIFIAFNNNTIKNFIKRKLRKLHIYIHSKE